MIADTITKQIAEALKARDEIRLSTLRLLSSALNYEFIAKQHKLSEEEELVVVGREAKKRKEAIEAYEKAGAQDRADKERKELEILSAWLPAQMPDNEIEAIVTEAISQTGATSIAEMGKVMGAAMAKVAGRADGTKVSEMVKQKLSNL
ncbi:MAG TPA: GatB/YqeY domain-containing protein [Patescibacteria group bacterium]|nr:GatB/YqeY domain-containing protein [Patescibacteria group bacterium]